MADPAIHGGQFSGAGNRHGRVLAAQRDLQCRPEHGLDVRRRPAERATGCVESFNITSAFPSIALATFLSPGGTSGIVLDSVSASGHASSLYYSPLGTAIC